MHLNGATWFAGHRARMVLDSNGVIPVAGKNVVWYMAFDYILPCMRNNISIYLTKRVRRGIRNTHGAQIYRKSPLCDITSYANTIAFQYIPTARCSPKYLNIILWNIDTQYAYSSRSRTYYATYTSALFFDRLWQILHPWLISSQTLHLSFKNGIDSYIRYWL